MQTRMDAFKKEVFGDTPKPVNFHRREIMNRTGPFSILKDPALRAQFDERLFKYLEEQNYIVITVVIDKREHLSKYAIWHYDPYHYCMHCLVERYCIWLNRNRYKGDVVIEPRYKKEDRRVKDSYNLLYRKGTDWLSPKIAQRVLTTNEIKFIQKSQNWAGLQIADLIAHPSFRAMRLAKEAKDPPPDFGSRIADLLEQSKLARHPSKGTISGYGRKWLPAERLLSAKSDSLKATVTPSGVLPSRGFPEQELPSM